LAKSLAIFDGGVIDGPAESDSLQPLVFKHFTATESSFGRLWNWAKNGKLKTAF
jgi:hypothetical protein